MESVQRMIDALKSAAYEITALLLPGAVLIAVGHWTAEVPLPDSTPAWFAASYVLGLVLQGASSWMGRRSGVRHLVGAAVPPATPAETRAKEIIEKDLGKEIADDHLLDVVLTRTQPHRQVYDKFLALADTAKSLALVSLIAFGLLVLERHTELDTASTWLMLVGTALCWLSLCERHRRFAPIACKALYGKFVALYGNKTSGEPTDAQRGSYFNVVAVNGYTPRSTASQVTDTNPSPTGQPQ